MFGLRLLVQLRQFPDDPCTNSGSPADAGKPKTPPLSALEHRDIDNVSVTVDELATLGGFRVTLALVGLVLFQNDARGAEITIEETPPDRIPTRAQTRSR